MARIPAESDDVGVTKSRIVLWNRRRPDSFAEITMTWLVRSTIGTALFAMVAVPMEQEPPPGPAGSFGENDY